MPKFGGLEGAVVRLLSDALDHSVLGLGLAQLYDYYTFTTANALLNAQTRAHGISLIL